MTLTTFWIRVCSLTILKEGAGSFYFINKRHVLNYFALPQVIDITLLKLRYFEFRERFINPHSLFIRIHYFNAKNKTHDIFICTLLQKINQ